MQRDSCSPPRPPPRAHSPCSHFFSHAPFCCLAAAPQPTARLTKRKVLESPVTPPSFHTTSDENIAPEPWWDDESPMCIKKLATIFAEELGVPFMKAASDHRAALEKAYCVAYVGNPPSHVFCFPLLRFARPAWGLTTVERPSRC